MARVKTPRFFIRKGVFMENKNRGMEAWDYIKFAYNNIGMNIDDSDSDKSSRVITAKAQLALAKKKLLLNTVSDCFVKQLKLTRTVDTISNPTRDVPTTVRVSAGYEDVWYGYYIPYDYVRTIKSNGEQVRLGDLIYSPMETGLEIQYVADVEYNKIEGTAQFTLLNMLTKQLALRYGITTNTNLMSIIENDENESAMQSKFDNNNRVFYDVTNNPIKRW